MNSLTQNIYTNEGDEMRVNVYTEELPVGEDGKPLVEVVTANYVSSRTGMEMTNFGLRVYLRSHPALHYADGRDDDRSAVTFWVGSKANNLTQFLEMLKGPVNAATLKDWHDKTVKVQAEADAALSGRIFTDGGSSSGCGQQAYSSVDVQR